MAEDVEQHAPREPLRVAWRWCGHDVAELGLRLGHRELDLQGVRKGTGLQRIGVRRSQIAEGLLELRQGVLDPQIADQNDRRDPGLFRSADRQNLVKGEGQARGRVLY